MLGGPGDFFAEPVTALQHLGLLLPILLNGDPRRDNIDWVEWIERIPANFETRYYVMRVIGNAVSYSHMYPSEAGRPRTVDTFLR